MRQAFCGWTRPRHRPYNLGAMPLRLEALSQIRVDSLPRLKTVFFFPVGPIEDHGPHLPLGADLLEADRLCWIAAERLEKDLPEWIGVVMPAAPLGIESDTTALALTVRPHVLRDWLVDSALALHRYGFRRFAVFSGHAGPRQLTAIEEAGKIVRRRAMGFWWKPAFLRSADSVPILVSVASALVKPSEFRASPFWPDPLEHGGARDTSVLLAIAPDRVDAASATLPPVLREGTRWTRLRERASRKRRGYWGDPSAGSAARGRAILAETLDDAWPKIRAVLEGASPDAIFRSWYSILPPNKSFFVAHALAATLFVIMLLWVLFTFQMMVRQV